MSDASLVGAWRLESFVFTDQDGGKHFPLGESPKGAVLISPDGHLSLSFMAAERLPYRKDAVLGGSEVERSMAATSYVSFGGPCRIEGDEVVVEVEHAFHPNWAGGVQRRKFVLDGDRLTLSTIKTLSVGGRELMGQAVLRRAGA